MRGLESTGSGRRTPPDAYRPRPAAQLTGRQELVQDHQEYWAALLPSGRKQIGLKVQLELECRFQLERFLKSDKTHW